MLLYSEEEAILGSHVAVGILLFCLLSGRQWGGGGAHKESLSRDVEMYHRGLQTLQPCLFILLPMLKKGDVLYNPFLSCFTQEIKCFFN